MRCSKRTVSLFETCVRSSLAPDVDVLVLVGSDCARALSLYEPRIAHVVYCEIQRRDLSLGHFATRSSTPLTTPPTTSPTMPPIEPHIKNKELSPEQRTRIIELQAEKKSQVEIADIMNVSGHCVQDTLKRWEEEGSIQSHPRAGRPKALDERDIRHLVRLSNNDANATLDDLTKDSGLDVCKETVGRTLRKVKFYVRWARHKPYITPATRYKRLVWARQQHKITPIAWRRRVFTDEVKVEMNVRGSRPKVCRPPNTEYEDRYLAPALKNDQTSAMFWGAVGYGHHSPLVGFRQRTEKKRTSKRDRLGVNSKQYSKEVLKPHLLSLMKRLSRDLSSLETIEDGAGYHKSSETRAYRLRLGIRRMEWPPYSSDLNLIENVWALLKAKLRKSWRKPENRPHSRQELIVQAQCAWEELDWRRVYSWFERMPKRCQAVIKRRGRSTRW